MRFRDRCSELLGRLLQPETRRLPGDRLPSSSMEEAAEDCLVVDASPSMQDTDMLPTRFFNALCGVEHYSEKRFECHPGTLLSLCLFSCKAFVAVSPRPAGAAFIRAIEPFYRQESGNGTNFISALMVARGVFLSKSSSRKIVLLTDGNHNLGGSKSEVIRLSQNLQATGVVIEAIGIGQRSEVDERFLLALVSTVHGRKCYRWIGDDETELIQHYGLLAAGD